MLPENEIQKLKVKAVLEKLNVSQALRKLVREYIADVPDIKLIDRRGV